MAVNQRSTATSRTQELPTMITRVALYARVSTLNGQDPEMQLSELREYASLIRVRAECCPSESHVRSLFVIFLNCKQGLDVASARSFLV